MTNTLLKIDCVACDSSTFTATIKNSMIPFQEKYLELLCVECGQPNIHYLKNGG